MFSTSREAITYSVLYPHLPIKSRLALKLFRGEPAITRFDWNFTSNHSSSAIFLTIVGSVLHVVLPTLQPGHG